MSVIDSLPSAKPFVGISADTTREFGANGRFRVLVYAAYDAYGLIGSEHNGIAIVKLNDAGGGDVVLKNHARQDSGYYGPSKAQLREFGRIAAMEWAEFRAFCNNHLLSQVRI